MAKDPAFLFYPGDWQGGTMTFSRFLKGCYMDLLIAQFNNGHLALEEIKTVLGADFGQSWPILQKKFDQDGNGLFFNTKLETEINKRLEYSAGRRKNREGTKQSHDISHVKHMSEHMENGNENKDVIKNKVRKGGKGEKLQFPYDSPKFTAAWALLMLGQKWKNKSDVALQASLNKLAKESEEDAIKMINNCTAGSWQGLVELKPHEKTQVKTGMKGVASAYDTVLKNIQNE